MMMNDLNTDTREVASPLGHDLDGRFSRKGVKVEKVIPEKVIWCIDTLLIGFYIFFLLASDFVLFTGSGNVELFKDSIFPVSEVSYCLIIILIFSFIPVLIFYKISLLKHIMAALASLLIIYAVFKQFAQFYTDVHIGSNAIPLYTVIGIFMAALTYVVFAQQKILYKVMLVLAAFMLFLRIYITYTTRLRDFDFIEINNTQQQIHHQGKRFIYLMFPNLVSPSYFTTLKNDDALKTQQIMQGYFLKNNFRYYTKAYTTEDHYLKNMIKLLNPRSKDGIVSHILNTKLMTEYWRFYNLSNDYIFLKNNEIYDVFRRNNFQISAYKTRDLDMCHKNHKFNVNRCVEKINHPINIFDVDLPTSSRVNVLMIEWLGSMQLFGDMSKVYNFFQNFFNLDGVPMLGISYNNLYVVNSIKTFNVLLEDIKEDDGKQAYFALIDLPSDMYVYDEFCRVKPRDKWLNMKNLPWVKNDYTLEKQKAYLQQTRCLFGKLEQFTEKLKKENIWDSSVFIIQGVSGVNNFRNFTISNAKEDFIANRLVALAIHDYKMNKGERRSNMCAISNIVSGYLFRQDRCLNEDANISKSFMSSLEDDLKHLETRSDKNDQDVFSKWYTEWAKYEELRNNKNAVYETQNDEDEDFGLDIDVIFEDLNKDVFTQDSNHDNK